MAFRSKHPIVRHTFELPRIYPIKPETRRQLAALEAQNHALPHRIAMSEWPRELVEIGGTAHMSLEGIDPELEDDEIQTSYRGTGWHVDGSLSRRDHEVRILTSRCPTIYCAGRLRVCGGFLTELWQKQSAIEPGIGKTPLFWHEGLSLEALDKEYGYSWIEDLQAGTLELEYVEFSGIKIVQAPRYTVQRGKVVRILHKSALLSQNQRFVPRIFYRSFSLD